jgi:hypothetical protein
MCIKNNHTPTWFAKAMKNAKFNLLSNHFNEKNHRSNYQEYNYLNQWH